MTQCQGVIFIARSADGHRAGMAAPRLCREPAAVGEYCRVHHRHRDLQDLYRQLLAFGWERRVANWERERARVAERRQIG